MTTITRLGFTGILLGLALVATAAEPKKGGRKAAPYLCAQVQMTGNAGGSYANAANCNAAKPGLKTDAETNGKDQCTNFCKSMSCRAVTVPDPLAAAPACRGPDPANQKWYGHATTGPFDCKCMNP